MKNREIKFKAVNNGIVCDVIKIDFKNKFIWILIKDGVELRTSFSVTKLIEYTGLKDKNGKEIYEGDIVKGEHTNWDETGEVRWYQGYCGFGVDWQFLGNEPLLVNLGKVEIIGNIYENGDLLK